MEIAQIQADLQDACQRQTGLREVDPRHFSVKVNCYIIKSDQKLLTMVWLDR